MQILAPPDEGKVLKQKELFFSQGCLLFREAFDAIGLLALASQGFEADSGERFLQLQKRSEDCGRISRLIAVNRPMSVGRTAVSRATIAVTFNSREGQLPDEKLGRTHQTPHVASTGRPLGEGGGPVFWVLPWPRAHFPVLSAASQRKRK